MRATQKEIDTWKARHRKVYEITVQDGEEAFVGYFKRPDMDTVTAVTKLAKTDEVKSANILFDNCWLGGDDLIKDEATLKLQAISQLEQMTKECKASIKNL